MKKHLLQLQKNKSLTNNTFFLVQVVIINI